MQIKKLITRLQKIYQHIDFNGLTLLLGMAALFLFFNRFFNYQAAWEEIRVEVTANPWEYGSEATQAQNPIWLVQHLTDGETDRDWFGTQQLQIKEIDIYDQASGTSAIYMTLRVRANFNATTQERTFNGTPLKIGNRLVIETNSFSIPTQIIGTNQQQIQRVTKPLTVTAEAPYVLSQIAQNIKTGDTIVDQYDGDIVAKVLTIETQPSNYHQFHLTQSNQLVTSDIGDYQQVIIKLEINTTYLGNQYLFQENQKIKYGSVLDLVFDQAVIHDAQVIAIED